MALVVADDAQIYVCIEVVWKGLCHLSVYGEGLVRMPADVVGTANVEVLDPVVKP